MSEGLFIGTELIQIQMPHQKLTLARATTHKSCNLEAEWTAYRRRQVRDLSFPDSLAGLSFFRSVRLIEPCLSSFSCLRMSALSTACYAWRGNLVNLVSFRNVLKPLNILLPKSNELPSKMECVTSFKTFCVLMAFSPNWRKLVDNNVIKMR